VPVDARDVTVHFGSNDYLGLAHGRAKENLSPSRSLSSSRHGEYKGSLLVSGFSHHHEELEHKLLELKGLCGRAGACALLFPSGYAANLSLGMSLGTLHPGQDASQRIHIFSDSLNHASIIDGIMYAKARGRGKGKEELLLHIYKHNDVDDLRHQLDATPTSEGALKVVFTESVFSMDGDICPLREIVELKKERKNDFLLVLDEAHATLVLGQKGGGLAQHLGLSSYIDITVGTYPAQHSSYSHIIDLA
jgi:8-amino-7-oxononanoate synthase